MIIDYLGAFAGAGKTHQIIEDVAKGIKSQSRSFIIASPTKILAQQTETDFNRKYPDIFTFRMDGDFPGDESVARKIMHWMSKGMEPHVLFTTHTGIMMLPENFQYRCNWDLIVDELPSPMRTIRRSLKEHHHLFTDNLVVGKSVNGFKRVSAIREFRCSISKARDDEVYALFENDMRDLADTTYDWYVHGDTYTALLNGEKCSLVFYGLLSPTKFEGFRSAKMCSAFFDKSVLHQYWTAHGLKFRKGNDDGLRYLHHENGHQLTLWYGYDNNWSKTLIEKDDGRALKELCMAGEQVLGGAEFLWSKNKESVRAKDGRKGALSWSANDVFRNPGAAIPLPAVSHGLNQYANFHNVIHTAALNPRSDEIKFLNCVAAMSAEDVRVAITYSTGYQSIMRCSLRDPDNQSPKNVVVPNLEFARWLQKECFPGCRIMKLGMAWEPEESRTGRTRHHESNKEQKAAWRARKALEADTETNRKARERLDSYCAKYGTDIHNFRGTQYADVKDVGGEMIFMEFASFVDSLREQSEREYVAKENIPLISPAMVQHNVAGIETKVGSGNVSLANELWIDVDGPCPSPNQLASIFHDIKMIQYASYSSKSRDVRYRVIIPLSRAVNDMEYGVIWRWLVMSVAECGYPGHKVDITKVHASDRFRLPSVPKAKSGSLFAWYHDGRVELNVDEVIKSIQEVEEIELIVVGRKQIDQVRVDRIIADFQVIKNVPGTGNYYLNRMAWNLASAGMETDQIRSVLEREAETMNSPKDRIRQIQSIMNSLNQKFDWSSSVRKTA